MAEVDAKYVMDAAQELETYWYPRKENFEDHYDLVVLDDNLKQKGMESFVGNDPRTFFLRALQLLTSSEITHRVPLEGLTDAEIGATTIVEEYFRRVWGQINRGYRLRGRQPWIKEMTSFLLLTGWYAVTALFDSVQGRLVSEVWNPAEVFPEWGDEGLIRIAHKYQRSIPQAQAMLRANKWSANLLPMQHPYPGSNINVIDYWEMTDDGPANAVVVGTELVKALTPLNLPQIPVICGAVAGIPDRGAIKYGDVSDWKKYLGEGILAANLPVYLNYNRMATFIQQMTRDTATPKYLEQLTSDQHIVTDTDDLTKRGAVFTIGEGEDLRPMQVPPLPVEIQSIMFNLGNQIQRGAFSWSMYGNVQQEISAVLNAQIVAAGTGVLAPYHEAIQFVVSEIDNVWLNYMRNGTVNTGFVVPPSYPFDKRLEVSYELAIPSDLAQRAALARQLAPGVPLMSQTTVQDQVLQIRNPIQEQARIMKDQVMMHPIMQILAAHGAALERAVYLREQGAERQAAMYEKAADVLLQQIGQLEASPPSGPTPPQRGGPPAPSQLPPGGTEEEGIR